MFNHMSLKGIKRSNGKKMRKLKGMDIVIVDDFQAAKNTQLGSCSSDKEIFEADISTDVGKGKERDVGDSSEVSEVFPKELQTLTGKDLDSDFKEVQVEEKEMDIDLTNAET
ncbi:hypothetical protein L1987_54242 [Smallanthus sonchifolius]|uniref:Uncharacterized protein n=1 Tax=Smallanthus sonchifolius TaxID=185202 RepID=A0ACB9E799_9ASTR|nr:hypothetical protein L1987_54242 [Smallanthus sonchifolius]